MPDDINLARSAPLPCRNCPARSRGICAALSTEQLTRLCRHSRRVRKGAGERVTTTGEFDSGFYANVRTGVVKLTRLLADGRQQVVGLQFPADLIGLPCGGTDLACAEAVSPVELCLIRASAVEAMIRDNGGFAQRIVAHALRDLDDARSRMLTLGRRSALERVALFLDFIASQAGEESRPATDGFCLPLGRRDMADFLGLTIETVSRQITRLKTEGVIHVGHHRHVTVLDAARLRRACG